MDATGARRAADAIDLAERAVAVARAHGLPLPAEVAWSDRQLRKWGTCTMPTRSIRISTRLALMPGYVLDYVLVHELAHLLVQHHGPAFQRLVARYPLAAQAEAYLASPPG